LRRGGRCYVLDGEIAARDEFAKQARDLAPLVGVYIGRVLKGQKPASDEVTERVD